MKITVELIYDNAPPRTVVIEKTIRVKGVRFLNAINKEVEKRSDLGDWTRWNLQGIEGL